MPPEGPWRPRGIASGPKAPRNASSGSGSGCRRPGVAAVGQEPDLAARLPAPDREVLGIVDRGALWPDVGRGDGEAQLAGGGRAREDGMPVPAGHRAVIERAPDRLGAAVEEPNAAERHRSEE